MTIGPASAQTRPRPFVQKCLRLLTNSGVLFRAELENQAFLTGEKVTLTPVTPEDLPFLNSLVAVPDVERKFWDKPTPENFGPRTVSFMTQRASRTKKFYFSGWLIRVNGEPIGYIHLRKADLAIYPREIMQKIHRFWEAHGFSKDSIHLEVGSAILPKARGKGLGVDALNVVTRFAEDELGAPFVLAVTDFDNLGARVIAEKSGYSRVAWSGERKFLTYSSRVLK